MIQYPSQIDFTKFSKEIRLQDRVAKYGLPREVRFCKKCVESNQRPSTTIEYRNKPGDVKEAINFDEEGVCSACRVAEQKLAINWDDRDAELRRICDQNRRLDGRYDCIVPGSGGKDSAYVAHILKHEYGMHPLTVTWSPHIYTDWGRKNFDSWIQSGQDNFLVSPNGRVHRLLTRLSTELLLHPFQPFIFGQKSIAPKIASQMDISLIFYGEHEAEYGSPVESSGMQIQQPKFFSGINSDDIHISGLSLSELVSNYGIDYSELQLYLPVTQEQSQKFQVHYMGYYKKWRPQSAYYFAVENTGFVASPERTVGTYSKYSSIDDKVDDLHYYTTGIKFGRGRATEDAAQEIRSGEITRDEGVALVNRYDLEYPNRFMRELLQYLSIPEKEYPIAYRNFEVPIMDQEYFDLLCDNHRSPHIWYRDEREWRLRYKVGVDY